MTTPAQVAQIRAANQDVVELARRNLEAFWYSLDLSRPGAARDALLEFVPVLVDQYGEAAAAVAAEWYDDVRAAEGVRGRFRAMPAALTAPAAVVGSVRHAAGGLWVEGGAPTALNVLAGAVSRHVLQPGRDTIIASVGHDPFASGWRRIARAGGCDFCVMLAGRGGVYRERSVGFASHDDCNCATAPSWDPNAPEVDVGAYKASERLDGLRRRAAAGDESAQRQIDDHNARVRDWIESNKDQMDDFRAEAGA